MYLRWVAGEVARGLHTNGPLAFEIEGDPKGIWPGRLNAFFHREKLAHHPHFQLLVVVKDRNDPVERRCEELQAVLEELFAGKDRHALRQLPGKGILRCGRQGTDDGDEGSHLDRQACSFWREENRLTQQLADQTSRVRDVGVPCLGLL